MTIEISIHNKFTNTTIYDKLADKCFIYLILNHFHIKPI